MRRLLKDIRQISRFDEADAERLSAEFIERKFEPGDYLIREGDSAESLFLIESGKIGVLKKNRNESVSRVRELGAGAMVGEMALFGGAVRSASVIADEAVTAHEIRFETVEKLAAECPEAAVIFYRAIGESLARKLKESTVGVAELMALSRLTALGELLTGIAHEINNPLTIVRLLISQIGDEVSAENVDRKRIYDHIASAEQAFDHIARIMAGLKLASHNTRSDIIEDVPVYEILENTAHLFRKKAEKAGIKLTIAAVSRDLTVPCRPAEMSQVVLNLISNACDAIEASRVQSEDRWIRIDAGDRGTFFEIAVTDSGPGIPPEVQEKMFEPFYSTKTLGKGTGIGLSLSKKMVEGMNGKLNFRKESKNTCFVIRLPKSVRP